MVTDPSDAAPVRVRFAPSPTGSLHLGSALVALANAAFARTRGGSLLLRIDDTDAARSSEQDARDLPRLVGWLGITWNSLVRQRERAAAHAAAVERLLASGQAYRCFCSVERLRSVREAQVAGGQPPRYDGTCRELDPAVVERHLADQHPYVLRLRVEASGDIVVIDAIHGRVTTPAGSFGDPALTRSDGSVGYLLASVVDDVDFGITHVIRGEDHLPNAARQQLLFEALEAPVPAWAHLPLLRDESGGKLSKRSPLGTLDELIEEGVLPVTVRRYLAELLGQGAIDLLAAGADSFDLARVSAGAPRVDRARLESIGREDVTALDDGALRGAAPFDVQARAWPLARELAGSHHTPVGVWRELQAVLDGPGAVALDDDDRAVVELAEHTLRAVDAGEPGWADGFLRSYRAQGAAAGLSTRALLQPLRRVLTGAAHGPALGLVLEALGPDVVRARLRACGNVDVGG